MFGNNAIMPVEKGSGYELKIVSIFNTIQGEGPYTGYQAVFIRLGGCNLACSFCDTEFEQFSAWSVADILTEVEKYNSKLIVITGGEPFRQPIGFLCRELIACGLKVQIETNGTLYREIPEGVEVVCSPKNTGAGYYMIREDILKHTIAIKFIISNHLQDYNDVAEVGQSKFNIPVYVQPMDEYDAAKNQANISRTMEIAKTHGYIVSLQMHKILGVE